MPKVRSEETIFEFLTYPTAGADDWRYTSQSAQVRVMEMLLLTRATLMDMANAPDFASAAGSLGGGDYALSQTNVRFEDVDRLLREKRVAVRALFAEWMLDEAVVTLFRSRDDFANLRLALRRVLTERPVGDGYSSEGNVAPEVLAQVFEEDNYALLPDCLAFYPSNQCQRRKRTQKLRMSKHKNMTLSLKLKRKARKRLKAIQKVKCRSTRSK